MRAASPVLPSAKAAVPHRAKRPKAPPGKRVNVAAALCNSEYYAPMYYQQPTNSALFEEWFEESLLPMLPRGEGYAIILRQRELAAARRPWESLHGARLGYCSCRRIRLTATQ